MRSISTVSAAACACLLAACATGAPQPKEPTRLDLTVSAAATVNPDDRGRAAPIVVRIYELRNDGAFKAADFFTLQDREKTVLADDVVKRDQLELRPGDHRTIVRKADPATTAIGVLASYRDLATSEWRAVYAMPSAPDSAWYRFSAPKLKLAIDLDTNAINITEVKK